MNRIETIKAAVSPANAAERYGLTVGWNGMTLCPFHDDHHPSLRLYDDHFYCFACAAHGDVIDLTAKLLGISVPEAIRRLEEDFGINTDADLPKTARPARPHLSRFREDELLCLSTLTEYERLLRGWKTEYAPKTPDDPVDVTPGLRRSPVVSDRLPAASAGVLPAAPSVPDPRSAARQSRQHSNPASGTDR